MHSLASNAPISIHREKRKRSLFTVRFGILYVYQIAWYKCYGIKRRKFYNYKKLFINGDLRTMNANNGLQKSRLNTIAICACVN